MTLSDLAADFERDGFVNAGRVLDDDLLQRLSDRIDAMADGVVTTGAKLRDEANVGNNVARRDRVWQILDAHRTDDVIAEVCHHDAILDRAEALIGEPIRLYSDQILMKPAHHGSVVPWHQDYPYWRFDRPALATCWLAVDDATVENGCMRLIPGSHTRGPLPTRKDLRLADQEGVDESQQVCVELPAGHCLFHHCLTLHATSANTSPNRRRAIAITYMPADLKWTGPAEHARDYPLARR